MLPLVLEQQDPIILLSCEIIYQNITLAVESSTLVHTGVFNRESSVERTWANLCSGVWDEGNEEVGEYMGPSIGKGRIARLHFDSVDSLHIHFGSL